MKDAIAKAQRPPNITPRQWLGVKQLLYAIAFHYPNPCPSQETLAKRRMGGLGIRTVQRYTQLALQAGLITVVPNSGMRTRNARSYTHSYHIKLAGLRPAKLAYKESTHTDVWLLSHRSSTKTCGDQAPNSAPPAPTEEEENLMAYADEVKRANEAPKLMKRKPMTIRGAHGIVAYFDEQWWARVVHAYPHMRTVRVYESVPAAVSYIKTNFKHRSDSEIREIVDEFMAAAVRESAGIKPGQSAWLRFTGWWGRQPRQGVTQNSDALAAFLAEHEAERDTKP